MNNKNENFRLSEQMDLEDFVFHLPVAVFRVIADPDQNSKNKIFQYVSRGIEAVTGYPSEEFQNQSVENFLRLVRNPLGSDSQNLFDNIETPKTCEFQISDKSGEERRLRIHLKSHPDEKSKSTLLLIDGVVLDVTQEWKMSESLKAEKMKLVQASRLSLIGELSVGIAHEINNPLAIVMGKIEGALNMLRLEKLEDKKIYDDLGRAIEASKRVAMIVNSIKVLARKDGAEPIQALSLRAALSDSLGYVVSRARNNNVELRVESFEDIQFQGRLVQASQVFINLIMNALDAVMTLPEKWIEIKVKRIDDFVEIRFIDSGMGIPGHLLEKIMDPFFTTKDVGKGTGLGLSISRNIIESFGGRLFYELYNSHTSFVVHLSVKSGVVLLPLNIEEAISAHTNWKQRIMNYIKNPDRSLIPSEISSDQRCSLGRWIMNHQEKYGNHVEFMKLKDIHREFHLIAGEIVVRANQGEKVSFDALLSPQSLFFQKSTQIIQALLRLRESVESVSAIAS